MNSKKAYSYCFTINNWTDADMAELSILENNPKTRYIIVAKEVAPETGTPHIQGYVYFHHQMVLSSFRKLLTRAAIFIANGTVDQNVAYCSKTGDFYEKGDRPLNQKRKGDCGAEYWEHNKKLLLTGRIEDVDPKLFITHYRSLKSIQADYAPMPSDLVTPDNHWYYGPTGTGKSLKARTENPGAYLKMCNKWWDGYNREEVVLIEDFDKSHHVLGHHLKIWADRYAFPAEVKGSKVNLRPAKIIVTSNYSPADIWPGDVGTLEPILRRFNVVHFATLNLPPSI